jgi:hypothetical protein
MITPSTPRSSAKVGTKNYGYVCSLEREALRMRKRAVVFKTHRVYDYWIMELFVVSVPTLFLSKCYIFFCVCVCLKSL